MKTNKISLLMIARGTMYLLSLNLLVFLRRQLGERMAIDLCVACGFSWFCFWIHDLARQCMAQSTTRFFLYALTILTICHLLCFWLRTKKPATAHSFSRGRPFGLWRILRVNDVVLQRYVQPTVCLGLSLWISRWDRALACWTGVASAALFAEEQLARFQMRRRVLDTIDGRIDSQTLYERVRDRLSPETKAAEQTPVVETPARTRRKTGQVRDIVSRLDPELRGMMEPVAEARKTEAK